MKYYKAGKGMERKADCILRTIVLHSSVSFVLWHLWNHFDTLPRKVSDRFTLQSICCSS
jgi:hypothetical protein